MKKQLPFLIKPIEGETLAQFKLRLKKLIKSKATK